MNDRDKDRDTDMNDTQTACEQTSCLDVLAADLVDYYVGKYGPAEGARHALAAVDRVEIELAEIRASRPRPERVCIGCDSPQGQPHQGWCPVVTGTLNSLPGPDDEDEGDGPDYPAETETAWEIDRELTEAGE